MKLFAISAIPALRTPRESRRLVLGVFTALAIAALSGCAGDFGGTTPAAAVSGITFGGNVHGGQQPLTGAHIYLYAAGATGYASPSVSLLDKTNPAVSTDSAGNGYVLSGAGGNFTISNDWTCPHSTDQLYILVTGGNPGITGSVDNTAIAMMGALGTCSNINASTFVVVNELSTVAAVNALQQFMTDSTHVGASAGNATGLAHAFTTATNMVRTYVPYANATTPAGNGTVPYKTLNSLANALAACVNSASAASDGCTQLFTAAKPPTGSLPGDTVLAGLDIAKNPNNNVLAIYNLAPPQPPFQPGVDAKPNDWTVGIQYTLGNGQPLPGALAIDAAGNIWMTSMGSEKYDGIDAVIKLSPFGEVLSGLTGFTNNGNINLPEGLAIDTDGSVWVTSTSSDLLKLNNDGSNYSDAFPAYAGSYPQGIAIDASGNAWLGDYGSTGNGGTVREISKTGEQLNVGLTGAGFSGPQGVAIDTDGYVWVAGRGSNSLLKIAPNADLGLTTNPVFTGGGLDRPSGLAIDSTNRVWADNSDYGNGKISISLFNSDGSANPNSPFVNSTGGYVNIVAIDGLGTAWTVSCGTGCVYPTTATRVIHVGSDGALLNTTDGYQQPSFDAPQAVAIDASGNLWIANSAGQQNANPGSVTEIVGAAAPVMTPLQAALKAKLLGQRP